MIKRIEADPRVYDAIKEMWEAGVSTRRMAALIPCSLSTLLLARKRMGLPPRLVTKTITVDAVTGDND